MGNRGPKPVPTAVLSHRGSWRAKIKPNEPKPQNGTPQCPQWLNGEAKKIWKKIVPQLVRNGIMTKLDGFAFARYCLYSVLWLKELSNPGRTEATLERYANQLNRLEQSFGLTPSARTSLNADVSEKGDDSGRFFKVAE